MMQEGEEEEARRSVRQEGEEGESRGDESSEKTPTKEEATTTRRRQSRDEREAAWRQHVRTCNVRAEPGAWLAARTAMDEAIDVVLLQEVALRPEAVEAMRKVAHKKSYRAYHTRGYADVNGIEHAGVLTLVHKRLPSRQRGAEGGRGGQVLAVEVAQVVVFNVYSPPHVAATEAMSVIATMVHTDGLRQWFAAGDWNTQPDKLLLPYDTCRVEASQVEGRRTSTKWNAESAIDYGVSCNFGVKQTWMTRRRARWRTTGPSTSSRKS